MIQIKKVNVMCVIVNAKDNIGSKLLVFIFVKTLLYAAGAIITAVCYFFTLKKIKHMRTSFSPQADMSVEKLLLYPAVLLATLLPIVIFYFATFFLGYEASIVAEIFLLLITHSLGLFNAMVYGLQRRVYRDSIVICDEMQIKTIDSTAPVTRHSTEDNVESNLYIHIEY